MSTDPATTIDLAELQSQAREILDRRARATSVRKLAHHIRSSGACAEARRALRDAIREYKAETA